MGSKSKKIIGAIDIGANKTVAVMGEVNNNGEIYILGIGEVKTQGISKGGITRLDLAVQTIYNAFKDAIEMAGVKVNEVVVSITHNDIKSQNIEENLNISPYPVDIEQQHVDRLLERAITKTKEDGYEIIAYIPKSFSLDNQDGIINPIGLIGTQLLARIHVIKANISVLRNFNKAINLAGINVIRYYPNVLASASAVLTQEEKEEGVLLVDMGANITGFVLFLEGSPVVTGSISQGGIHITKDIAYFLKTTTDVAEKIKLEHGSALVDLVSETERIKLRPRGEDKEIIISKKELAEVIQIRLEEIIENIITFLHEKGYTLDKIRGGIVLTGGGAKLNGICELFERLLGLPTRVGYPENILGLKEKVNDPAYAGVVGLLKLASQDLFEQLSLNSISSITRENNKFKYFLEKAKTFLKKIKETLKEIL